MATALAGTRAFGGALPCDSDTTPPQIDVPANVTVECGADASPSPLGSSSLRILDSVVDPVSGHTYLLLDHSSWPDAEAVAVALGGHLVTVNDAAEQAFIFNLWGNGRNLWIGFTDAAKEGTFAWSSGAPVGYTNWQPGEPNGINGPDEDFAYMLALGLGVGGGSWNDTFRSGIDPVQPPCYGVVELTSASVATATDDCDPSPSISFKDATAGQYPLVITRSWIATDVSGNSAGATQLITVVDTTAPVLSGVPANVTIQCGEAVPAPPAVSAFDACHLAGGAPSAGLVLHYPFDTNTGTLVFDKSGNSITGKVQGSAAWRAGGPSGSPGYFSFPGVNNSYIYAGTNSAVTMTGAFSLAVWICPTATYWDIRGIIAKGADTGANSIEYGLAWYSGQIVFRSTATGDGGIALWTDNAAAPLGKWTHVVCTVDGSGMGRVYINGAQYLMGQMNLPQALSGARTLLIGRWRSGFDFSGGLDDVRIYNRALTTGEVASMNGLGDGQLVRFSETKSGTCPAVITRTWSATDIGGNSVTATQTITIADTTPPVLDGVPVDISVSCGAVPTAAKVTATDSCAGVLSDAVPPSGMNPVLNPANGHYYQLVTNLVDWSVASNLARVAYRGMTGHLAVVTSQQENDFVLSLLPPIANSTIIGGIEDPNVEGKWYWVDGEAMTYTNWAAGQPDNQYRFGTGYGYENRMYLTVPFGLWHDGHDKANPNPINGHCYYAIEWDVPRSVPVEFSETSEGTCAKTIKRVWTATDACGNSASATQTITVTGCDVPVVQAPADVTVECGDPTDPDHTGWATTSKPFTPEDGLVLYYCFDQNEGGTVTDRSGHGNNGIVHGNCAFSPNGKFGGAFEWDGEGLDYISAVRSASLNVGGRMTMAAWFKIPNYFTPNGRPILEWVDLATGGTVGTMGPHLWTGTVAWQWGSEGTGANITDLPQVDHVISTYDPSANEWHHLAVTYDSASGKSCVYVDGVQAKEKNFGAFLPNTILDVTVGGRLSDTANLYKGLLDEVRVYNRALASNEVQSLFAGANTCSGSGHDGASYADTIAGACPTTVTRIWTAADFCGNVASATQTITVADSVPPTIKCPPDVVLQIDPKCGVDNECCARGQGYWKNHPDAWLLTSLQLGASNYASIAALELLWTPPRGDASFILVHQLIAAKLNVDGLCGGNGDAEIEDLLVQADAWLVLHPVGSDPEGASRDEGIHLAGSLEDYNEGETGPGPCINLLAATPGCVALPDLTKSTIATDSCNAVTIGQNPEPGTALTAGSSSEVLITAADACGNAATCTVVVSVNAGDTLGSDSDADGASLQDELVSGTDPRDRQSAFLIADVEVLGDGTRLLRWPGAQNRTYRIECSSSMNGKFWFVGSVNATMPETVFHDKRQQNELFVYRIRVMGE